MPSSGESVPSTIAAAVKELAALLKQLTNIVAVLQKNIVSYWKIKDAAQQRATAAKIQQLSHSFADLGFLQHAMAYETTADEFSTKIAATLDQYANKVEEALKLIEEAFPELIRSDDLVHSLPVLLEKKRVAAELRELLNKRSPHSRRGMVGLGDLNEVLELLRSFLKLSQESIEIARVMRTHADSIK
jgi:oligoendopeptidase F